MIRPRSNTPWWVIKEWLRPLPCVKNLAGVVHLWKRDTQLKSQKFLKDIIQQYGHTISCHSVFSAFQINIWPLSWANSSSSGNFGHFFLNWSCLHQFSITCQVVWVKLDSQVFENNRFCYQPAQRRSSQMDMTKPFPFVLHLIASWNPHSTKSNTKAIIQVTWV